MGEVQKFRGWDVNAADLRVFVPHEAYAKLLQALSDSATNTLTICGLRDMAVKRAEDAEAERDALKERLAHHPGVSWCRRSHKQAERICELLLKVASLEAQLSACTKAHYGQMAEEASAGVGGTALKYGKQRQRLCVRCLFGERPCASQSKKPYVGFTAGDPCTGFVERPQTQGL